MIICSEHGISEEGISRVDDATPAGGGDDRSRTEHLTGQRRGGDCGFGSPPPRLALNPILQRGRLAGRIHDRDGQSDVARRGGNAPDLPEGSIRDALFDEWPGLGRHDDRGGDLHVVFPGSIHQGDFHEDEQFAGGPQETRTHPAGVGREQRWRALPSESDEPIFFRAFPQEPALEVIAQAADGVHPPGHAACGGFLHHGAEAAGEVDDHAAAGADENDDVHHLHDGALRQMRGKSWRSAEKACIGVSMGATATSDGHMRTIAPGPLGSMIGCLKSR